MKKVAIILANLESPERRKYQIWPNHYQDEEVEIRCFSLNKSLNQDGDTCFDMQGKRWNLRRIYEYGTRSLREFLNFLSRFRRVLGVKKSLKTWSHFAPIYLWKPDIVHFVEPGLYPYLKPLPENAKTIVSFRGGDIMVSPFTDAKWRDYLTDKLFQELDCVHFICTAMLETAIEFAGTNEKYKMFTMGIDLRKFRAIDRQNGDGTIHLVTTARLTWQKGLNFALEAVKELRDEGLDIVYHLIGDGPLLTPLLYQAHLLGIMEHVSFHGRLNLDEVKELLAISDIYLQPSVTEGLPVAVIEAMAMELPVIATAVGGLPEVVVSGRSGLLVPVGNVDKLVNAIKTLISDPELRKTMGAEGARIVKANFSIEKERDQWLNFYKEF